MSLRIGDVAPDFEANTTKGPIKVHQWLGDSWGVLYSQPKNFTQVCTACHSPGVAGAPKVGDKAAWAPRIAQGMDTLVATAIKGTGAMPPKGGSNASEAEIRAVVTYMVNASK